MAAHAALNIGHEIGYVVGPLASSADPANGVGFCFVSPELKGLLTQTQPRSAWIDRLHEDLLSV